MQQFDDLESSREGASQRDTAAHIVRKHLEDIGLNGDIAQYNEISGLSGGELGVPPKVTSKLRDCFRPKDQTSHRRLLMEQPSGRSVLACPT